MKQKRNIPNAFIIYDDIAFLIIESKGEVFTPKVDLDSLKIIQDTHLSFCIRWSESAKSFYVISHRVIEGKKVGIHLHRLIMGLTTETWKTVVVDHIDHNGLNNLKSNLRIMSKSLNHVHTKSARQGSSTGRRGITKVGDRYMSQIGGRLNGNRKSLFLGYYDSPDEAESTTDLARDYITKCYYQGLPIEFTDDFKSNVRNYIKSQKDVLEKMQGR